MYITKKYKTDQSSFACVRNYDSLCTTSNGQNKIFPFSEPIEFSTFYENNNISDFTLQRLSDSCSDTNSGTLRQDNGNGRYDLTVCDIEHMKNLVLYFDGQVFVLKAPYPLYVHFILIIAALICFTGAVTAIQNLEKTATNSEEAAISKKNIASLLISLTSVFTIIIFQSINQSFYTYEDIFSFVFLILVYAYYFVLYCYSKLVLQMNNLQGILFDLYIYNLYITFSSSYISFDHPFSNLLFFVILFRFFDKMLRVLSNNAAKISLPVLIIRFLLDAFLICLIIVYAWTLSFKTNFEAYVWLIPLFYTSYIIAKILFLKKIDNLIKVA